MRACVRAMCVCVCVQIFVVGFVKKVIDDFLHVTVPFMHLIPFYLLF